jgi:hypothetical protein
METTFSGVKAYLRKHRRTILWVIAVAFVVYFWADLKAGIYDGWNAGF